MVARPTNPGVSEDPIRAGHQEEDRQSFSEDTNSSQTHLFRAHGTLPSGTRLPRGQEVTIFEVLIRFYPCLKHGRLVASHPEREKDLSGLIRGRHLEPDTNLFKAHWSPTSGTRPPRGV